MNWPQIEEITYSECDNPHKLLGPHKQGSKMLVQAYFPGAEKVTIHWKKTGQVGEAFLTEDVYKRQVEDHAQRHDDKHG